ncbi:MAG: RagB/SusD family nutrient uptake outer membrane protein [Muribaculaceae bacterium]|nr:RagB/SusD family nutrient uptake outer membrane protein [Muribaculaceae bacterium]
MKKIIYAAVLALAFSSCDDALDTTNYSKYDTSTFPTSQKDAEQIVTSIYNRLGEVYKAPEGATIFIHDLAGDEMFGGGSTSNSGAQGLDRLMYSSTDNSTVQGTWKTMYEIVFRANYAIEQIPLIADEAFQSAEWKNYLLGQAYFMRAWACWEMANLYETFPVLTSTEVANIPRSDVETVYTSIKDDLLKAIEIMPARYGYSREDGMAGRATRYAAEALLGRVWLFYTGFYEQPDLMGVTRQQVVDMLKDCRDNSGFGLEDDPREIWPYTNEYSSGAAYNTDFNTYVSRNGLRWVGNHSKETVWACHFTLMFGHSNTNYNRMGEYFGLRNPKSAPNAEGYPYGIGYTNGTVNPKMVEDWATDPDYGFDDKRLWGSVLSVDNAAEIYGGGSGGNWMAGQSTELPQHTGNDPKEVEKTLLHNKKYIVSTCYSNSDATTIYKNFFYAYGGGLENSNQYDNRNDAIYIRYADVLLMLDELEQTSTGMDRLRVRAGLKPYGSYTFERLQKERRYEFAFEGIRFNDLRRWYPRTAGTVISDNQRGAYIQYMGSRVPGGYAEIAGNGLQKRYEETRGFMPVPSKQIILTEQVLTQTPGWGDGFNWQFSNGSLPYPVQYDESLKE